MDHSRAFWRDLARLGVNARAAGAWFDKNGPGLFAYGARAPSQFIDSSSVA